MLDITDGRRQWPGEGLYGRFPFHGTRHFQGTMWQHSQRNRIATRLAQDKLASKVGDDDQGTAMERKQRL